MHQMQQEQKQRLTALCALETAVMSSEAQGADALLSLRGQPLTPNGGSTTSSIAICPPCTTPNEELRAALKNISRFRSRCKPTEAEGVLQQLLDDGSHSSATPSATAKAMEDWLVSAGGMQMATAVLSCFMKRPAVRAVQSQVQELENAEVEAMKIMIETAHSFLEKLKTNGNNYDEDENAIRVLLSALVPSGDITQMVSIFSRLLGMSRHRIMQGNKTQPTVSEEKCAGWTRVVRAEYKNKIDLSFASSWLHSQCRIDTNSQRKKRLYIGPRTYIEHWRHIMYDSPRGYHTIMLESQEYAEWQRVHAGQQILYNMFTHAKCHCMVPCDFTECADPVKTIFIVLLAVLHSQIELLVKAGHDEFIPLQEATTSIHHFLKLTLCPKVRCPSLDLGKEQSFYRQECGYHSCSACGLDNEQKYWRLVPLLKSPLLWSTTDTVEYQRYHPMPRGYNKKTQKNTSEDELVDVVGPQSEFMRAFAISYYNLVPHQWNGWWLTFQRGHFPKVMTKHEMGVFTDFAAVFKHRPAFNATCGTNYRSNLDVALVVHSPRNEKVKQLQQVATKTDE
jgi:hypothetical protein